MPFHGTGVAFLEVIAGDVNGEVCEGDDEVPHSSIISAYAIELVSTSTIVDLVRPVVLNPGRCAGTIHTDRGNYLPIRNTNTDSSSTRTDGTRGWWQSMDPLIPRHETPDKLGKNLVRSETCCSARSSYADFCSPHHLHRRRHLFHAH